MAAAIEGMPYMAACSPKTITFLGVKTMKRSAIGDKGLPTLNDLYYFIHSCSCRSLIYTG